jgi:regulator of sirC expression with transglutaminase-like and TPR domain
LVALKKKFLIYGHKPLVQQMTDQELKALISLLDDEDTEVITIVEREIRSQGGRIIPLLEHQWEHESMNPSFQQKIEDLIHDLQFEQVLDRMAHWRHGGAMDLLEGLWIIATYQYPDLSLEKLKADVGQLYYEAWTDFKPEMHPIDQVRTLNYVFFNKLKFGANTKNFHSPSNSMINIVLDARKGNPISLCCLFMLVAQRLNMPMYGVNLPNLFVLTYKQDSVQFYVNVFNKGLIFMKSDIDHYIAQLGIKPIDAFYQPCTNLDIMRRVLRNLALAFEKLSDTDKVKEIEQIAKLLSEEAES